MSEERVRQAEGGADGGGHRSECAPGADAVPRLLFGLALVPLSQEAEISSNLNRNPRRSQPWNWA